MITRGHNQNYYEVLEVPHQAQQHEIVAAYQRAKEAYAPDSPALYTMFTKEEAEELRKLIEEAFKVLGNQVKRREYDLLLLNRAHPNMNMQNEISPSASLPDLGPISEKSKVERPATQTTSHSGGIPDGFSRSRFSVYEKKAEMEQEILNQKDFDGAFLRKVRQYKNINLDQLSKETRISRSYIAALEADDYEALPAPVFVRGFVVQLAKILNLNENLVATSYMEKLKRVAKN